MDLDEIIIYVLAAIGFITIIFLSAVGLISLKEAQAIEMTASVPKSDYYVCLEDCQSVCLEFIK